MKIGELIYTPRFCRVKIENCFGSRREAEMEGYTESTHYDDPKWGILGKHEGINHMSFAAYLKGEA